MASAMRAAVSYPLRPARFRTGPSGLAVWIRLLVGGCSDSTGEQVSSTLPASGHSLVPGHSLSGSCPCEEGGGEADTAAARRVAHPEIGRASCRGGEAVRV